MDKLCVPKANNAFDHLRLLAAFMVLVMHQYDVLRAPAVWPLGFIGSWGVDMFFAISGYLNTKSLLSRRSAPVFLASRALRIYPALIFCVVFMVLLGACVTSRPLTDYFGRQTFEFLWRNAGVFLGQRTQLPGVFESNPVTGLNASLWTLPFEGRFYLQLAVAMFVVRYSPLAAVAIVGAALVALLIGGSDIAYALNPVQRFQASFGCGIAVAALERLRGAPVALGTAIGVGVILYLIGFTTAGLLIGFAAVTIAVGQIRVPTQASVPLDISYGFYLFAFPIQQMTALWGLSLQSGMIAATVLTAIMATISAVIVERPALVLADRLKRRQTGAVAPS